jgi:hypothetical protein
MADLSAEKGLEAARRCRSQSRARLTHVRRWTLKRHREARSRWLSIIKEKTIADFKRVAE